MPRRYVYNGNICVMHVELRQGAEPSQVFSTGPTLNNVPAPASFETDDHNEMVAWLKKNARGALALRAELVNVMLAAEPDQQFDVQDMC